MPKDEKSKIDWLTAGGALASLAAISPPAAAAAAIALGLCEARRWVRGRMEDEGPEKT